MKKFNELNELVLQWANDKGILEKATPVTQIEKTIEEVEETYLALQYKQLGCESMITKNGNTCLVDEEIKDGFGDVLITILIGCELSGLNPLECLETAYNVISKRTGKMINGTFVKD
jgi:hypothetical protein